MSRILALLRSAANPRLRALGYLSASSGLPLGIILVSLPVWLRTEGVSLQAIGLLSLAGLPWSLKFLWSPVVDRYALRWPGRRRSWILLAQAGLAVTTAALAFCDPRALPLAVGVIALLVATASATQDIALDAYAVEVMRPEEHGTGNGIRVATYRVAMLLAGGVAIATAAIYPWRWVFLSVALLFIVAMAGTLLAPEPAERIAPPPSLRDAIIHPIVEFFRRPRAWEIALFILLFKLGDSVAASMVQPFLVDEGYHLAEIGLAQKSVGLAATLIGSLIGGLVTSAIGLNRGLWVFGALQAFSNLGYWVAALVGMNRLVMYGAVAVENLCAGMGTVAFLALLTRLCDKRHSATQYALLSSLFGLSRTIAGVPSGFLAANLGYASFFLTSAFLALPGLVLLPRFAPWRVAAEDEKIAEEGCTLASG